MYLVSHAKIMEMRVKYEREVSIKIQVIAETGP